MRYRWIFFDIDDTLWDFSSNSIPALRELYASFLDIRMRFPEFADFLDEYHNNNAPLWQQYAEGSIDSEFLKYERFRLTVFPVSNSSDAIEISKVFNRFYLDRLCSQTRLMPGVIETLEALSRNYMIGAISNGFNDTQYRKIYNTPLWRYISRLIISDEIDVRKPDPGIFLHALRATGAAPDDSLMVGDSAANDIAGAINAGIDAIYFDRHKTGIPDLLLKPTHSKGKLIAAVDDLRQIIPLLS